jgi:hypothetical protein
VLNAEYLYVKDIASHLVPGVILKCIRAYVGLGAAIPVMSESSGSTGAHVQKRLVSPYAVVMLVTTSIILKGVKLTIVEPSDSRPELLLLQVVQRVRCLLPSVRPIPLARDKIHLTMR